MSSPPRLAYAALVAVCVIWGTTYLGIRVALEAVPPALMGAFRWIVAGTLLVAYVRVRGQALPHVASWGSLALQGLLMIGFGNGFVNWAEQSVPSGLAAVVIATAPFFMAGVEAFHAEGERISRRAFLGLVLGFIGIFVLVWPDLHFDDRQGSNFVLGLLALQAACLGWAIGSSYSKRHPHGESVIGATAVQMIFGGLIMLVVGTLARRVESRVVSRPRRRRAGLSDRGRIDRRVRLVHLRAEISAGLDRVDLCVHQPAHRRDSRRAFPRRAIQRAHRRRDGHRLHRRRTREAAGDETRAGSRGPPRGTRVRLVAGNPQLICFSHALTADRQSVG